MNKNKRKKPKAIGEDPFADMQDDMWTYVMPGKDEPPETPSAQNATKSPPPIIEIEDEADMALVSWLYLDPEDPDKASNPQDTEPASDASTEENLNEVPAKDERDA